MLKHKPDFGTMLKHKLDFGANISTGPCSSSHPGASFVPTLVQPRSILVKLFYNIFLILQLTCSVKNGMSPIVYSSTISAVQSNPV